VTRNKRNRTFPLLAVGGLDPSACAGILADVRVFQHYRLPYEAVATALTAQSRHEFFGWNPVPLKGFEMQLQSCSKKPFGVKIGMLGTLGHVKTLLAWVETAKPKIVLWDPVLHASTGMRLLRVKHWEATLERLLKKTDIFTPNIPEAEWILKQKINTLDEMKDAAKSLFDLGEKQGRMVVLKGGHLPSLKKLKTAWDIVYEGREIKILKAKARSRDRRGTGCTFGAALLAGLSQGKEKLRATRNAKSFVLRHLFDSPLS